MKIIGEVNLVFRDIETNEITKNITEYNNISDNFYGLLYLVVEDRYQNEIGQNIFIAYEKYSRKPNPYGHNITGIHKYGVTESGVTTPIFVNPPYDSSSKTEPYMEIQKRFTAPATDILINTIGIGNGTINTDIFEKRTIADAWVRLSSDCPQTTTETLDVFYRVKFDYDYDYDDPNDFPLITKNSTGISKAEAYQLMWRVCNKTSSAYQTYWYRFNFSPLAGNRNYNLFDSATNSYSGGFTYIKTRNTRIRKNTMSYSYGINSNVGKIIGTIGLGDGSTIKKNVPLNVVDSGQSPIQNIFGHNSTAVKPFYDATHVQSGIGKMVVDGLTWTDPAFPMIYKINVIDSGATGTATYKVSTRYTVGFNGNAYNDLSGCRMMYTFTDNAYRFSKPYLVSGSTFNLNDQTTAVKVYNHQPLHLLHVQKDDIMLMDVKLEEGFRVHNSTFPQFDATNIAGFDEEKGTGAIWVACRENGLYRIDNMWVNPSVTKITMPAVGSPNTLDRCLGVATTPQLGGSGVRVWALFSDLLGDLNQNSALGLYYSEDNGVTWVKDTTFNPSVGTYWTGSATEFLSMYGIWSDKNHPDCRIMVLYSWNKNYKAGVALDAVRSLWHDAVSGTTDSPISVSYGYRGQTTNIGARPSGVYTYSPVTYDLDNSYILSAIYDVSENQNMWAMSKIENWTSFMSTIVYSTGAFRTTALTTLTSFNSTTPYFYKFTTDGSGNDLAVTFNNTSSGVYNMVVGDISGVVETRRVNIPSYNIIPLGGVDGLCVERYFSGGDMYYNVKILNNYTPATDGSGILYDGYRTWVDYGWDGTNWVAYNQGKKVTHTSSEDTVNGIKISFSDDPANVGNAGNWTATDYYTFGVVDGVWLDGSTQTDFKIPYYARKAYTSNILESNTLPNTTKSISVRQYITAFTWQNTSSNFVIVDSGRTVYGQGGVYSSVYSAWGETNEFIPSTAVGTSGYPGALIGDTYCRVEFYDSNVSGSIVVQQTKFRVGLITQTRLDDVIVGNYVGVRDTAAEVSVEIDGYSSGDFADLTVYYSGVEQIRIPNIHIGGGASRYFTLNVRLNGHVYVTYLDDTNVIFDSEVGSPVPPPIFSSSPFENLYIDYVGTNSVYSQARSIRLSHHTIPDYYLLFGNQSQGKGHYNPNLYAVDYDTDNIEVIIDNGNVVSQHIGIDDFTTPLTSGQYSIIVNAAAIRYSPDDAGKAISIEYTEIDYP